MAKLLLSLNHKHIPSIVSQLRWVWALWPDCSWLVGLFQFWGGKLIQSFVFQIQYTYCYRVNKCASNIIRLNWSDTKREKNHFHFQSEQIWQWFFCCVSTFLFEEKTFRKFCGPKIMNLLPQSLRLCFFVALSFLDFRVKIFYRVKIRLWGWHGRDQSIVKPIWLKI